MGSSARALAAASAFLVLFSWAFIPSASRAAGAGDFVPGGQVTSAYCERTRNGTAETHPGTDIGVKGADGKWQSGGDVKAGVTGTVVKVYKFEGKHFGTSAADSDWLKNFNTVVIKGDDGKFYVYCHMATISVNEGDAVTPTTTIGTLGGLGASCKNTFGPHLHLEKRSDADGDGTWEAADEGLVCSGSKSHAEDPMAANAGNKDAKVESTGGSPAYSYVVTNECSSHGDVGVIDNMRISYGSTLPYIATAPPGWEADPWEPDSPAVVWRSTDPIFDIQPCQALEGFAFESQGREGPVSFFVDNDDGGHGGGLGRETVTTKGVAADPGSLDDFLCYRIRETARRCLDDLAMRCSSDQDCAEAGLTAACVGLPAGLVVNLVDQFDSGLFAVTKAQTLCTPVEKNGLAMVDPAAHLEGYRLAVARTVPAQSVHQRQTVLVRDQFGDHVMQTIKPDSLLVPSAKSLAGPPDALSSTLDHYKCYRAVRLRRRCTGDVTAACRSDADCATAGGACYGGIGKGVSAQVAGQFDTKAVNLKKPRLLCTPVDKNGEGMTNGVDHLVAYQVKFAKGEDKHSRRSPVYLRNQFGPGVVATSKEALLLVPALKNP